MASNDGLAPSPLDLLPPLLPPTPPPPSLPSQPHSAGSSSPPSRPIPIEIYNHILHLAFGRHLPPLPLEKRLEEPPSLAPLLPLTLVSKGLRELVLPFLCHHIVVRRGEDWIQLFDPTDGILVGEGEEATRRRGWIRKLSFARDRFPVSSWTPSKDQPATMDPRPKPNMAPLDFSGLGDLEEVYIGKWGRDGGFEREVEGVASVEMEGGPWLVRMEEAYTLVGVQSAYLLSIIKLIRRRDQTCFLSNVLSQTHPVLVHALLEPFYRANHSSPALIPTSFIFHPPGYAYAGQDEEADELSSNLRITIGSMPPSRFNLDLVLERLLERGRKSLIRMVSGQGWTKDEAGWWTRD